MTRKTTKKAAPPKRDAKVMIALTQDEKKRVDAARGTVPASVYLREKALS